jgi:hypothetical protein
VHPVPQLVPAGLVLRVPVAPPIPVVDSVKLELGIFTPHDVPSHVAVPFVGTAQAVHELPQVATLLLDTHSPPQLWKPELHWNPHCRPSQIAPPFAGATQAVHEVVPQLPTPELATHAFPHR